jgi:hypothetical protein
MYDPTINAWMPGGQSDRRSQAQPGHCVHSWRGSAYQSALHGRTQIANISAFYAVVFYFVVRNDRLLFLPKHITHTEAVTMLMCVVP